MKYKKIYEGNELVGYSTANNRIFIELYYYDCTAYGNFHKDYTVNYLKKIGLPSRFSTLKEAKEAIERSLI